MLIAAYYVEDPVILEPQATHPYWGVSLIAVHGRDVDPGRFSQSWDFEIFGKNPGISRDPGINVFL